MSYLGTNLNVAGSSTVAALSATTIRAITINNAIWSPSLTYTFSDVGGFTISSSSSTLPAAYLNVFFGYMIELSGTAGNSTLTMDNATNIFNYESSNPLGSRGGITTFANRTNGIISLASNSGVTIKGTGVIPAGQTFVARICIASTSSVTIHTVLSA